MENFTKFLGRNSSGMMKVFLVVVGMVFGGVRAWSATLTSANTGNWGTAATWTVTSGTDADGIPDSDDDVNIGAHVITVTAPAACISITFTAINGTIAATPDKSTLTINSSVTLTMTSTITINHKSTASSGTHQALITGSGTLTGCTGINIGSGTPSFSSNLSMTTELILDISIISTSTIIITQYYSNNSRYVNSLLTLKSGTINCSGTITMTKDASGYGTTSMASGSGTSTLNLSGSTTYSFTSGWTPTIDFTSGTSTVCYTLPTGAQTIIPATYKNLTLSNTSGIQTLASDITVGGVLTTTSGGTLSFGTTARTLTLSGTGTNTLVNNGTIDMSTGPNAAHVLSIAASSIATYGTITTGTGSTIQYSVTTGGQTIGSLTYRNLTILNTSNTNTASGDITVNGTLTTTAGGTLDMSTYRLIDGGSGTFTNNGTIKTACTTATSAVPIPTGKTWAGTVEYSSGSAQTLMAGTYTNLVTSGGAGTKTASGNIILAATSTLTLGASTTLDLSTNTLTGGATSFTCSGAGTLKTSNTSATPIMASKTWTGTIEYAALSGSQTVMDGTYNNLTLSNSSGTNTAASAITVGGTLTTTSGGIFAIAGNNITTAILSGAGTINSASGTPTLTINGSTNSSYTGVIGGGAIALTKSGSGTLTLSGTNTYTGLTTISAGTLKLGANDALGTTASGTSITSGAVLDLNGVNYSTAEALTVNGTGISSGGAIINSSSTGATYAGLLTLGSASSIKGGTGTINISNIGTITGATFGLTLGGAQGGTLASILGTTSGTLTKQDAGTWTLSGASTYTGLTTISAGTLKLGANGGATNTPLGTTGGATTVSSGGSLDLNGFTLGTTEGLTINGTGVSSVGALTNSTTTAVTWSGTIALGDATNNYIGTSGNASTGTLTVSGVISGSNPLQIVNTGSTTSSVILSGANTFSGATTIISGTLKLGVTSSVSTAGPLGTTGGGTTVSNGASLDLNGISLTSSAIESLTLNGTGVSNAGALTNSSTTAVTWIGATTLNDATNNYIGTSGNASTGTLTVSGTISGASKPLQIVNTGATPAAVILSNTSNSYGGATTILSGTLRLGASGVIPDASAVTVTGTLDMAGYSETVGSIAGAGTIDNSTGAGTYTLTCGGDGTSTTFSGTITDASGSVSIVKNGTGALTLTGTNSHIGGTTINAGTLNIGNNNALGTSTFTINGGAIDATSADRSITNPMTIAADFTFTGSYNLTQSTGAIALSAVAVITTSAKNLTLGGVISESGTTQTTISATGNGTWTCPYGVTSATVYCWGGGGGGYASYASSGQAGFAGGGGGTISVKTINSLSGTYNYTVGTGGAGGTVTSGGVFSSASDGGSSFFGNTTAGNNANSLVLATGGLKAVSNTAGGSSTSNNIGDYKAVGGTGGTARSNDPNCGATDVFGGGGGGGAGSGISINSPTNGSNANYVCSGAGGTGTYPGGAGGYGRDHIAGTTGNQPGGGGAGASNGGGTIAQGAAGGDGQIIITYTSRSIEKAGAGTLTLSGTNTFTGGVKLSVGTLNINNSAALGTTAGTFTIAGGTIDNTSGSTITTSNYPMTWSGNFTFTGTNALNLGTGATAMSASRIVTVSASTLTVGGIISGSTFGLTKAGAGTLKLSGVNTYTGATTISAGVLETGVANAIPVASTGYGVTFSGGTLNTGASTGYSQGVVSSTNMGTLTMSASSSLSLGSGNHNLYFSAGSFTASTTLTITGWTGTGGSSGTAGKIFCGSSSSGLTSGQLAQINFTGYGSGAMILNTGEVVPISCTTPSISSQSTATQTVCINSAFNSISVTASGTSPTYQWYSNTANSNSGGTTLGSSNGAQTDTYTPQSGSAGTLYYYCIVSACSTTATSTVSGAMVVNPLPSAAGTISGTATVCQGQSSVSYSVSAITNATSYTWSYSGTGFTPSASTASIDGSFSSSATSGNLTVIGVNSCGNGTTSATFAITVNPLPSAAGTISGTSTVCQGQSSVSYSVPSITNATSYTWSYSGTGFTPSASTASITGTFSSSATSGNLTVTGVNSCGNGTTSATYAITVNPLPAAAGAISGTSTVCQGQSSVAYSVSSITNATSYTWSYTGTGFTPSASTTSITGTFSSSATSGNLTVTGVNSCGNGTTSATYAITVNPLPAAAGAISGTSTVCQGQSSVAYSVSSITNATSYTWSYSGTGFTPSASTTSITSTFSSSATSGNLTVTGVNSCGNGTTSATYAITVNPLPAAAGAISGTSTVCQGQSSVSYSVPSITNATSYTWSYSGTGFTPSASTASITGTFSSSATSGNLTVTGVNSCGNGTTSATYAITVNPLPTPSFTAQAGATACSSTDVTYTTQASKSNYTWSVPGTLNTDYTITSGGTSSTDNTVVLKWLTAGSKIVTINFTDGNGCTAASATSSTATTVTVKVTPSVSISASSTSVCAGSTVTFTAIPNNGGSSPSYQWKLNGNNVGTNATTYVNSGLSSGDVVTVVMTANNTCQTNSTVNSTNDITMSNANVTPTISISANNNTSCAGSTVTFSSSSSNGGAGPTYQWKLNGIDISGATNSTYSASTFLNNDKITVVMTSNASCVTTSTATSNEVTLTRNALPTVTTNVTESSGTTNDGTVCSGSSVTLAGLGASSYSWDNSITNGVAFTASSTTTYTVTGTDANGCQNTATRTITVNALPTVTASVSPTTICEGGTVNLTGVAAMTTYSWTGPSGVTFSANNTVQSPSVTMGSTGGTFTLTATNNNGCSASATTSSVTVNALPTVGTTVTETSGTANDDGTICSAATITLAGTGANSYTWDNGVTNNSSFTGPTTNTTYTVTGTDANGCQNTATRTITVNALPTITASVSPTTICEGGTVNLTGVAAMTTYSWTGPSGATYSASNSVQSPNVTMGSTGGTFTLTATNSNGCSASATTSSVTVNARPSNAVLAGSTTICNGSSTNLTVTVTGGASPYSVVYSGGSVNNYTSASNISVSPTTNTTYTLTTVTDANGCTATTPSGSATVSVDVISNAGTTSSDQSITSGNSPADISISSYTGTIQWEYSDNNSSYSSIGGATSATLSSAIMGTLTATRYYRAVVTNGVCSSATSNVITITVTSGVTTFYYVGSGSMATLTNWGANTDGTGTNPTSMTAANHTFYIIHNNTTSPTSNISWTLHASSKIIVGDGSNATNFIIDSSFPISGTIDVANNATLTIASTSNPTFGTLDVGSTIAYAGSTAQTLPVNASIPKLTINNSNGVAISGNTTISGTLNLTLGKLIIPSSTTLTLGTNSSNITINGGSSSNYIVTTDNTSEIRRYVNSNTSYVFPMGDATYYTPMTFTLNSNGGLTNAYLSTYVVDAITPGFKESNFSSYISRYWSISPSGMTTPNYNISYTYDNSDLSVGATETALRPVKVSGGTWYKPSNATNITNGISDGTGSVDDATNTLSWTGLTTFSFYTGAGDEASALPISLLYFTAKPQSNRVRLDWATASETNNDYFTVERSQDGEHFNELFKKPGAGISTTNLYYFGYDNKPFDGVSYYRLKQTDFDGKFEYSGVESVNFTQGNTKEDIELNIYPNPVENGTIHINFDAKQTAGFHISLYDAVGKLIYQETINAEKGPNDHTIELPSIAAGMYELEIRNDQLGVVTRSIEF